MMIKIFTTGQDGKITMSAEELKKLLDEAYWEGYRANNHTWTYTTPSWKPFYYTTTATNATITLSDEAKSAVSNTADDTICINGGIYGNNSEDYKIPSSSYSTTSCATSCNSCDGARRNVQNNRR